MSEVKQIGNYETESTWDNPQTGRVYSADGISPTPNTCNGGDRQPKIVIGSLQDHAAIKTDGICTTLTEAMGMGGGQTPMIVASRGRNPQNPSDRTPGNHVEQRLEPNSQGICRIETPYRIRKLTPLECWKLMDFTEADFRRAEAVNSNTQLYKQAGNSIVKAVLMAIFKQMM